MDSHLSTLNRGSHFPLDPLISGPRSNVPGTSGPSPPNPKLSLSGAHHRRRSTTTLPPSTHTEECHPYLPFLRLNYTKLYHGSVLSINGLDSREVQ